MEIIILPRAGLWVFTMFGCFVGVFPWAFGELKWKSMIILSPYLEDLDLILEDRDTSPDSSFSLHPCSFSHLPPSSN